VSGRKCIVSSFDVRCCIVKDHDMVIIWVVFLKDVDRFFGMLEDALIVVISIASFPSPEQDMSRFSTIRRLKVAIICGDKVGDHQQGALTFWLRLGTLILVPPMYSTTIMRIECRLVMEPHDHIPDI